MFTIIKSTTLAEESGEAKVYIEAGCLSTDDKPTNGIATGSLALEADTGDIYAFDEEGGQWNKING